MSLLRRDAARTRLGVVALLTAVLLLAAGILPALARPASRGSAAAMRDWVHRAVRRVTAHDDLRRLTPGDTVVVFGPKQAATPTGAAATTVEQFTVPQADAGRRYLLRVENGAGDGSGRVGTGTVQLNGASVVASAQLSALASGGSLYTPITVQAGSNTLAATVQGTAGAHLTLRVVTAADPTFTIWGAKSYERTKGTPVTVTEHVTLPTGAGAPYLLYVTNGDGARRSSSASVTLNGAQVVGPADLNQNVAGFVKPVTLQPTNTLQVQLQGAPGSRLSLRLVATDVVAPVLAITAPTAGLVTKEPQIAVVGTVTDQTPTQVTANGVAATLQGTSGASSGFSATVPLGTEGTNTITVRATDAAGHVTDSVRTVIRDTEAPTVSVTSLPDTAIVSADSSAVVSGTVHDATKVTANLNGAPVAIDSATGAFSKRVTLQPGVNFLTLVATDAAGNATTVVRQVTRDAAPPTLTVTAPSDSLVTSLASAHVAGTATAATALTVTVNGTAVTLGAAGAFAGDVALVEGGNTITVRAMTAAGTPVVVTRTVIRDTRIPVVALTAPADGLVTRDGTITLTGTATDATRLTLTLNGAPLAIAANGAFTATRTLEEGAATFTFVATDAAGNVATVVRQVVRDATAPAVTLQNPVPGAYSQTAAYQVSGSVSDATAVTLTVNGAPVVLAADGGFVADVVLVDGPNAIAVAAIDAAGNRTDVSGSVMLDAAPPALVVSSPAPDLAVTRTATLAVTGTVADRSGATVLVNGIPATLDGTGAFSASVTLTEGENTITLLATDGAGNTISAIRQVRLDTQPPVLTVNAPQDGALPSNGTVSVDGSVQDASASTVSANGTSLPVTESGAFSGVIPQPADGIVAITATDAAGSSSTVSRTLGHSSTGEGELPPDPRTVAPILSLTKVSDILSASSFLYSGANPIQTGLQPSALNPVTVAVLRGRVITRSGSPLPGASVTINGHPEFGRTTSRADGGYDLVVNGGPTVVEIAKTGYPTAQRQLNLAGQDYGIAEPVVLVPYDTMVTRVDFSTPAQTARSSAVTDGRGTRSATLIFRAGTTATLLLPDSTTRTVDALHVRATEYTVGARGPASMPGVLPPASGYTYAVELSADEAVAAGALSVTYSKPVSVYVDNFLHFPTGAVVPVGFYDRVQNAWLGIPNGRVVAVLDTAGGMATIDVDGHGVAATPAQLDSLGFDAAELARLATLYAPGATLWRVQTTHFSPCDMNWPIIVIIDAEPPGEEPNDTDTPKPDCQSKQSGSIIGCERRTLGEAVPLAGIGGGLSFTTERALGYAGGLTLDVPLSRRVSSRALAALQNIVVHATVAGRVFEDTLPPAAGQTWHFAWDGRDAYGRLVQGYQRLVITVGYVYPSFYALGASRSRSFGEISNDPTFVQTPAPTVYTQTVVNRTIGRWDARGEGFGGWTLGIQHRYDPLGRILYLGDGSQRSVGSINAVATTVVGNGEHCNDESCTARPDGTIATQAPINPSSLVALPDGGLIVADANNSRIWRVGADGRMSLFAGNGQFRGANGDGGPARDAAMDPFLVDRGPDGSIYVADDANHRIRKIDRAGRITTIAGTGECGSDGDGGPATAARLCFPEGLAVGPDGSVYVMQYNDEIGVRIRRIAPDGIITTFAGSANQECYLSNGPCPDSVPASQMVFGFVNGLTVDRAGNLFAVDGGNNVIWRISTSGIVTRYAGNGQYDGTRAEGAKALDTFLDTPLAAAVAEDGTLYVSGFGERVIRITPSGIVTTAIGDMGCVPGDIGHPCYTGTGAAASATSVGFVPGLSVGPDGRLYVGDFRNSVVRRVEKPLPAFSAGELAIASSDGSELYQFDGGGRHLATRAIPTNVLLRRFDYDTDGYLTSTTDADSNTIRIERTATGAPTAIVAPFGQRTTLAVDANGYLASVTGPLGNRVMTHHASDGLLATFADANEGVHSFAYDSLGRLTTDTDPLGGVRTLTEATSPGTSAVTFTSAGQVRTTHVTSTDSTGTVTRRTISPDGTVTTTTQTADNATTTRTPDGVVTQTIAAPDALFGGQRSTASLTTITMPSGLTSRTYTAQATVMSDPANPQSVVRRIDTVMVNGATTTRTYDAVARALTTTSAEGQTSVVQLDSTGRMTGSVSAGLVAKQMSYDARGRLQRVVDGGQVTTLTYDATGTLETMVDPLGLTLRIERDAFGQVLSAQDGAGTMRFSYDSAGHLSTITPPGRQAYTFHYSASGLRSSYQAPDGTVNGGPVTAYRYDAANRLHVVLRPEGDSVIMNYDSAGRPVSTVTADGTLTTTYDPTTGQLAAITSSDGASYGLTYDGSLIREATLGGVVAGTVTYGYDNFLRPTSFVVNGDTARIAYDRDGRVTAAGSLTVLRSAATGLPDSTRLDATGTSYGYDAKGAVTSATTVTNGALLYSYTLERDALSRVIRRVETMGGLTTDTRFAYDSVGRLHMVTRGGSVVAAYDYDVNGNRLRRTSPSGIENSSVDARDQLLTYGDAVYDYTASGTLRSRIVGSDTTAYHYDAAGALRWVRLPNGTRIDYVVDPAGRRVGRKVNGALVQGFVYQTDQRVAAELKPDGAILSRFVYGTRAVTPEYLVRDGRRYRLLTDALGSVRLVVDAASGDVAQKIEYDEYGRVVTNSNPGFQPFGFAGGLLDDATGLVRFGARDYDPTTGRWTSSDPAGFTGSARNLHVYVANDPVNNSDPSGLGPFDDLMLPIRAIVLAAQLYVSTPAISQILTGVQQVPQEIAEGAKMLKELADLTPQDLEVLGEKAEQEMALSLEIEEASLVTAAEGGATLIVRDLLGIAMLLVPEKLGDPEGNPNSAWNRKLRAQKKLRDWKKKHDKDCP